jgi:endonuclease YncB( thermonuclease family)
MMKHLIVWLPMFAISAVTLPIYQQWQQSQPNYDNPTADWKKPSLTRSPDKMQSEHWNVVPGSIQDGSTFQVKQQGRIETVRLACTNAPTLDQSLGVRSRDYLRSLLAQADNHVILTTTDSDRQGRKVAEVNVPAPNSDEEKFIQYEMVAAGLAYPYEKFADHCPNWDVVQQGLSEAKQDRRGVWAVAPAIKP